ncbi:MAG: 3-dehydroquinate synthase [Candidatus Omnitrophica bacterium]|nr:3-dehydroquinate synthase [Candidatus Omnitrophota bacterium]
MKTIRVALKENSYSIVAGLGILEKLPGAVKKLDIGRDAVIITNPMVRKLYAERLAAAFSRSGFTVKILEVADSERSKSMDVAVKLIGAITRYAVDKKPFIVALGGGVVGDLSGFVAAVYKRGIPFIQVPTTLLAQIDSAIGGKVAVDLPEGKNLVGSFYQPKLVWSDVSLLASLSERQLRNGLAEAVKYGVIADAKLFSFIEKNVKALLRCDKKALSSVIFNCAAIKARVVEEDEKETKGIRTILNFGHTVGHAVETACGYEKYNHGEAVALGMRAACRMSVAGKLLLPRDALRVEMLLSQIGLPQSIAGNWRSIGPKIMKAMKFDKKFEGRKSKFILAKGIGHVAIVDDVPGDFVAAIVSGLTV